MKVTIEMEGTKAEITSNGVSMSDLVDAMKQAALGVGFHPENVKDAMPNEDELGALIDYYVKDAIDAAKTLKLDDPADTSHNTRPSVRAYANLQRRNSKHKKHIHRLEKKLEDAKLEVQGYQERVNKVQATCNMVLNAYKDIGVLNVGVMRNLISDIVGALNGQDYRLRGWTDPMLPHAAKDMENVVRNNITKTNHVAVATLVSDITTLITKLDEGSGTTFMSPLAKSRWGDLTTKFMQLRKELQ